MRSQAGRGEISDSFGGRIRTLVFPPRQMGSQSNIWSKGRWGRTCFVIEGVGGLEGQF